MREAPNSAEWRDFAESLGQAMQRRRAELSLSQETVAYAAGVSRYTYQKLEKGEARPGHPANPSLLNLLSIAQALSTSVRDLLPEPPDLRLR